MGALQFLKPTETPEKIECDKKALSDSEIEQMISDYQTSPLGMKQMVALILKIFSNS